MPSSPSVICSHRPPFSFSQNISALKYDVERRSAWNKQPRGGALDIAPLRSSALATAQTIDTVLVRRVERGRIALGMHLDADKFLTINALSRLGQQAREGSYNEDHDDLT